MKLSLTCTMFLAAIVALACLTAGTPAKHLSPSDQALYKTGKALYTTRHCDKAATVRTARASKGVAQASCRAE